MAMHNSGVDPNAPVGMSIGDNVLAPNGPHPDDARLGYPPFTPGADLNEISPWANRIEGMLTRINVRLLTLETRTAAALSGGLDANAIRQEVSTLRDQAIEALKKTAEVVETNIRGTQDRVQSSSTNIELNSSNLIRVSTKSLLTRRRPSSNRRSIWLRLIRRTRKLIA